MTDRSPRFPHDPHAPHPKAPDSRHAGPRAAAAGRHESGSDPGLERAATDAGRMGDKIGAPDPAAAPVQGDAEASGQPTSRDAVERMVEERQRTAARSGASGQPGFARNDQHQVSEGGRARGAAGTSIGMQTSLIALVALVVIGLLAGILFT